MALLPGFAGSSTSAQVEIASGGDPYAANVVLLMGWDSGTTSPQTDSTGRHSIYWTGGTVSATNQVNSSFGNCYYNGNSSTYATMNDNLSDFELGTDPFTIELFFRLNSTGGYLFDCFANGSGWRIRSVGSSLYNYYGISGGTFLLHSFNPGITSNTWYHYAMVRDESDQFRYYLNGTNVYEASGSGQSFAAPLSFLRFGAASGGTVGYFDEARVTKGVARYSGSSITTPTEPFVYP